MEVAIKRKFIKFWIKSLLSGCFVFLLSSCDNEISNVTAEYKNGVVTYAWSGSGKVNVYRSESADGEFHQVDKARNNSYTTTDADSYFVFKVEQEGKETIASEPCSYIRSSLGPNVKVFTKKESDEEIQRYISGVYEKSDRKSVV